MWSHIIYIKCSASKLHKIEDNIQLWQSFTNGYQLHMEASLFTNDEIDGLMRKESKLKCFIVVDLGYT